MNRHNRIRIVATALLTLGLIVSGGHPGWGSLTLTADKHSTGRLCFPISPRIALTSQATVAVYKPAQIDVRALALLKKTEATMLSLKSYSAECRETDTEFADPQRGAKAPPPRYTTATLTAERPNRMRYDAWPMRVDAKGVWTRPGKVPRYTYACDGTTVWKQFGKTYGISDYDTPDSLPFLLQPWGDFYSAKNSEYAQAKDAEARGLLTEVQSRGMESVEGVACQKIDVRFRVLYAGEESKVSDTLFIGPDSLVHRKIAMIESPGDPASTDDYVIRNIRTNIAIPNPSMVFSYSPPEGVKLRTKEERPALLANGVVAPDFSLMGSDGATHKLSDYRGKVVVVDFWATWCGPCTASMPHTQTVARQLKTAGIPVVVLALDDCEDRGTFAHWVKAHPQYNALDFMYAAPANGRNIDAAYRVSVIPTQYVIDAQGVVRGSIVGYGGETDDLEKAIRAAVK